MVYVTRSEFVIETQYQDGIVHVSVWLSTVRRKITGSEPKAQISRRFQVLVSHLLWPYSENSFNRWRRAAGNRRNPLPRLQLAELS